MGPTSSKARAALVAALGLLCQGQLTAGTAWADAPAGGMETHHGPSLITIDNSNADSWLEVDRTANVLAPLSKGTAGSDHDGGGGAVDQTVSASQGVGVQAAPDEHEGEEEGPETRDAATGGDDDEGDADTERAARSTATAKPPTDAAAPSEP
ncbi:hypothetical protein NGF19_23495 [Streptomyces sp. RY43-2]|uniref:Uncharacterized protein n=1 Tax=Streptomyces macrolidinus TaxID=2952607 RepID=A0ABT0ZJE4_9ACTN|nr:hypothetical protein [Streptomyces macrolidinus]MCN9243715.1 hypothetical protein [Streptomyces macrolidinus]